jgi:hypothetical protein
LFQTSVNVRRDGPGPAPPGQFEEEEEVVDVPPILVTQKEEEEELQEAKAGHSVWGPVWGLGVVMATLVVIVLIRRYKSNAKKK